MTFCTPGRTIGTPVRVISERRRPIRGDDPEKRQGRVTAVDAYPEGASPYSLMDMVGNLGEWHAPDEKDDVGTWLTPSKSCCTTIRGSGHCRYIAARLRVTKRCGMWAVDRCRRSGASRCGPDTITSHAKE